ncbi:MAG: STAS/SEC14 domain-containing protein [Myxococcota bacterium]
MGTLVHRTHDDGKVRMDLAFGDDHRLVVRFEGRGTMPGTYAFVEGLQEVFEAAGPDGRVEGMVDLSKLRGAPLRGQIVTAKGILPYRKQIGKVAIVGAGKAERKFATAALKIVRIDTVRYCDDEAEARDWLGWG